MAQYELEGLFSSSLDGMKGMIDTNTVIGKPIATADGSTVIPITRVSLGYGMGGWDYGDRKEEKATDKQGITAGSGGGVSIQPIGFLVISNGDVKIIKVDSVTPLEKICDVLPDALQVISEFLKKK